VSIEASVAIDAVGVRDAAEVVDEVECFFGERGGVEAGDGRPEPANDKFDLIRLHVMSRTRRTRRACSPRLRTLFTDSLFDGDFAGTEFAGIDPILEAGAYVLSAVNTWDGLTDGALFEAKPLATARLMALRSTSKSD